MKYVGYFLRFWYDFIVGDDWLLAAGVVIGIIVTALFAHAEVDAWWLMPVVVAATLAASLWWETRHSE